MNSRHARFGRILVASVALLAVAFGPISSTAAAPRQGPLGNFKHIVVIYEENHSFDNLYGNWGTVGGQHVVTPVAGLQHEHVLVRDEPADHRLPLLERALQHRPVHSGDRRDLP